MISLLLVNESVAGNFFLPVRLDKDRFGLARSGSAMVAHERGVWLVKADLLSAEGVLVQASMWETFNAEREAEDYRDKLNFASGLTVPNLTDMGEQRKLRATQTPEESA